ncbi:MAG: hypothetical protein GXO39_05855 [Thermotogae bacterium]|nr:hypothetical protein [Thermotogota bacterium]
MVFLVVSNVLMENLARENVKITAERSLRLPVKELLHKARKDSDRSQLLFPVSYSGCSYVADTYKVSNGYMEWLLDISNGSSDDMGSYTARTGTLHTDPLVTILYGADLPSVWSSFTTIRSERSNTEYITTNDTPTPSPGYTVLSVLPYTTQVICNESGPIKSVTFVYNLTNGGDNLTVKEIFWVMGSNSDNTRLWHKTIVRNDDVLPTTIGVRWQYDTHLRDTDHPAHYQCDYYPAFSLSCGPQIMYEAVLSPIPNTFDYLRTSDTDPPSGLYHIFAVYEQGPDSGIVSPPDMVYHAYWVDAYNHTWTWSLAGQNISLGSGMDNAFVYFWDPVTLLPGDSAVYYSYIGATRTPASWDDPTSVEEAPRKKAISVTSGGLLFKEEGRVEVYRLDGRLIFFDEVKIGRVLKLPRGLYMVRFKGTTMSVLIR